MRNEERKMGKKVKSSMKLKKDWCLNKIYLKEKNGWGNASQKEKEKRKKKR